MDADGDLQSNLLSGLAGLRQTVLGSTAARHFALCVIGATSPLGPVGRVGDRGAGERQADVDDSLIASQLGRWHAVTPLVVHAPEAEAEHVAGIEVTSFPKLAVA
jgi:hypothetical protein